MTPRIRLDDLTSDQYDQLCERLERAERNADPELQHRLEAAIRALGKSETELAALRQVARGYCPHCGRGDATPTVEDWEQQLKRADRAEARLAHLQATSEAAGILLTRTTDERDQLRAALTRARALADRWVKAGPPPLGTSTARWWDARLVELHAAILNQLQEPLAARTHDAGPAVAECRDADRRWELEKTGE